MCNKITFLVFLGLLWGCQTNDPIQQQKSNVDTPYLVVLGTIQDAGSPHIGCTKSCCENLFDNPDPTRKVVSLGIIDPIDSSAFILEATPDIASQLSYLNQLRGKDNRSMPDGILLTHAHIGHYTGLMYLGREAISANRVPVYAMPGMTDYLSSNGPWDQLVALENIELRTLKADSTIQLNEHLRVTPIRVPHRDEYSETVGFIIEGPTKRILFIPDIDKWYKWDQSIVEQIQSVDYAFIDATFYDAEEIGYRDMSEIPHPFIVESMSLLKDLSPTNKAKVHFIHLNHTNPALDTSSKAYQTIVQKGYSVARFHATFNL